MCLATRDLCQLLRTSQLRIESVALLLRRCVLPIRTVGVTERSSSVMNLVTWLQLLSEGLAGVEILEQGLGLLAPEDGTVLHSGAADTFDPGEVAFVFLKALQDEVYGIEPHTYRGVDLAFCRVLENALLNAIFVLEVIVEGDFGLVVKRECRVNHDT